ncbi:serralysin [Pseudovibrio ascidiaceicola]|uniref:Serralysin n=1 Tax=Pseudovibrio ascidiaceicola TaxID=285279 RepID=A0A1I4G2U4_9HYPH|nr:M10 family metallopeptidase C-terminal domain-containing protein [Pseudovibrio ascidiaceicola]SFK82238.1 serralysin [Pseudovibrio ascidiaceicola]SFL23341.1 serralysin [Pseudovibrio ascidiaceicola]
MSTKHNSRNSILVEKGDAPTNFDTPYTLTPRDTFHGSLKKGGDADFVAVVLEAGVEYAITMDSKGHSGPSDTSLAIFNPNRSVAAQDTVSGNGSKSEITFTPEERGTYYILAGSGTEGRTSGNYLLSISEGTDPVVEPLDPEAFTNDQIAHQLTDAYWGYRRAFDVDPGGTLTVNISGLTDAGQYLAENALDAWTKVTGINFEITNDYAQINIDDKTDGAYANSWTFHDKIERSFINIGTDWLDRSGTSLTSYSYQTYIHEIGHALGLGHAGHYNGSATYGVDNHYSNDSWQATVMSYFTQQQNTSVDASYAQVITPMIADILAMQDLYGTAGNLRTDNTTYGENSNAGDYYDGIADLDLVAFTIMDDGGEDTIDFSSEISNQRISLIEETYSDVQGLKGNMAIMRGTVIENALSGSGDDALIGNDADNKLYANEGHDLLQGGKGNDWLYGGAGLDTLEGGQGKDKLYGEDGRDVLDGGTGNDKLYGGNDHDILLGGGGNDKLYAGKGNDTLEGGSGKDLLSGGKGRDIFVFNANCGADKIIDFSDGLDFIRFDSGASRLEDLAISSRGDDAFISYEGGSILLTSVDANFINTDDFMFA